MKSVIVDIEDGLATIAINRPEALNALTPDIVREIHESVESLGKSDEIRAIAIMGRGNSFSAGCDIVSLYDCVSQSVIAPARRRSSGGRSASNEAILAPVIARSAERDVAISDFMDLGRGCVAAIGSCPKPVIAGAEGWCLGGGFEILLACDLVFASEDAVFGFPEVELGLIPGFGGTQLATSRFGAARAKELIMTGRRIDAQTASAWGLINRVVSCGSLQGEIKDFARNLCKQSPQAITAAKRAINSGLRGTFTAGMSTEREEFLKCFNDPNSREQLSVFMKTVSKRRQFQEDKKKIIS